MGWRKINSMGYSQEYINTITSSMVPYSATMDMLVSCGTVVIILKDPWRLSLNMASLFMTLIPSPRLMRAFGITMSFMCTSTVGIPGSRYLGMVIFPCLGLASFLMTLIIGASLIFLPSLW